MYLKSKKLLVIVINIEWCYALVEIDEWKKLWWNLLDVCYNWPKKTKEACV